MVTADGAADAPLRRNRLVWALALGAGLAAVVITAARFTAAGDGRDATGLPTEAEARAVLEQTYQRAKAATDARAFCEPSGYPLSCLNHYNEVGGRGTVPLEPPQVIASRTADSARVLTVCGVDGRGRKYRADFPVERRDDSLRAILDVFWDSKTYSGNKNDGEPVQVSPHPQQFSC